MMGVGTLTTSISIHNPNSTLPVISVNNPYCTLPVMCYCRPNDINYPPDLSPSHDYDKIFLSPQ